MITIKNAPTQEIVDFIRTIETAFFTELNAYITFDNRVVKSTAAIAYTGRKVIYVHMRHRLHRNTYENKQLLSSIAHELGHVYQRWTMPDGWFNATDYAKELFADDFAAMCLGKEYKDDYRSHYPYYSGFKTQALTKKKV